MNLTTAREILAEVNSPVPTSAWSEPLTSAVQRGLAELYLLSPYDDVDGKLGARTRAAWALFKEATGQASSGTIEKESARRLAEATKDPAALIGRPAIALQPDFEFRRRQKDLNRERSAAAIIQTADAHGLDKAQIAYVLATAEHESDSFSTLEEYASGDAYENRADLGNSQPGDGRRFKGRGYVQLTGRRNYTAYATRSGVQVLRLPVILMNWPALSTWVLVDGMMRGAYTGKPLDQYVNGTRRDFVNARRVVNGLDRADKIAAQAERWLARLG